MQGDAAWRKTKGGPIAHKAIKEKIHMQFLQKENVF
jgi:hypothetical protein